MPSSQWSESDNFTDSTAPPSQARLLRCLALGLEILGGIIIAAIAIYLRFADLHPKAENLNWHLYCQDVNLNNTQPQAGSNNAPLLYSLVLVIPTVFILIGELEYFIFTCTSQLESESRGNRVVKSLQRSIRILSIYLLGVLLASFSADYLKILILCPRPYFINVFGASCPQSFQGEKTAEFYSALKSFPSHLATVTGFTSGFAVDYAHRVRPPSSVPVMLPLMTQGFAVLASTTALQRYSNHFSHLSDVTLGILIGVLIALYLTSLITFTMVQNGDPEVTLDASRHRQWPNFLQFTIPKVSLPPSMVKVSNNNFRNLRTVPSND